ncbi:MAG: carotenoid oxygenase family protein [Microcoleaceae cyanobacterium]
MSSIPTWNLQYSHPGTEFPLTALALISGAIPPELRGTLYRNGPGRLERGGRRVGHWFDGDGAVLAVHFTETGAEATYRYVQTQEYQQEEEAEKLLFAGYGMVPPGSLWDRFTKPLKNAANTSVLPLEDRVLTLWEGGLPYALDSHTLETQGIDHLGSLTSSLSYSAHPKQDPLTGELFNFGVSFGSKIKLNLYRSDKTGQVQQKGHIPLKGVPLIHDFVLAGQYLVFLVSPVRLQILPVLTRLKSFGDALQWQPSQATQILVIDRSTLELVSRGETDPWFQWHFGNGYVDESGMINLTFVGYDNFNQTNQYLKEVATGKTSTPAKGSLRQIRVDPQTAKVLATEALVEQGCEFPSVAASVVGQSLQRTYLSIHRPGVDIATDMFGAIAVYNHQTESLTVADFGEHRYPTEPLSVPNEVDPQGGWVIVVVFDSQKNSSEVWIFEAHRLDAEPVCRLGLPSVVPNGFHGRWQPA